MKSNSAKILVIEDNVEMAELLATGLQRESWEMSTLNNGAEALAWLRQQKFDLVLLDLGLPGLDGTEVLRQIKFDPASEHIPVIVMTGRQGASDKLKAFELGAADYITKPFLIAELRARVGSILHTKQLRDELAQSNQQLRVKADFLAGTSHEMRTQLGAITGLADLMTATPLNEQQQEYLQAIRSSGHSLLTLLNDILNASKLEAGKLELERNPFHLRLCLDEALDLLAVKTAERKLELLCEIEPGTPEEVVGDPNRLRQVLINLVSNAIKFTKAGEVAVTVSARPAALAPNPAKPDSSPELWEFHFSVRDTGMGIPANRLGHLFQSYSQTDSSISRQFGGTGLGLYICKGLVELMGGRIWAESIEGQGSTFHFTISLPTAPTTSLAAWQGPQQRLTGRRVLIVDDTPDCARLVAGKAQGWGMTSLTACNRLEALHSIEQDRAIDLAVIDLAMPDVDGAALAREVCRLVSPRKLPVILLTPVGCLAPAPGASGEAMVCVNKPVKPAVLHSAFLKALGAGPVMPAPASNPQFAPIAKLDSGLGARLPLRILLTDDNLINQKVGGRMLSVLGYKPDIAGSGHEVLAAFRKQAYDLVLMDVQMPEMDGLEATRRLRVLEKRLGMPPSVVVALTANAMPGNREECLAAGMNDYLAKPVQPDQLQSLVERVGQARQQAHSQPAMPLPGAPPALSGAAGTPAIPPLPRASNSPGTAPPPASAAPASVIAPAGIDFNRLLDFAGGSSQNLIEIIDLHEQQTSGQLAQMKDLLTAGQPSEMGRLAHTIAGASGLCGLGALSQAARQVERACLEKQLEGLPALYDQLLKAYEQAHSFLQDQRATAAGPIRKAA